MMYALIVCNGSIIDYSYHRKFFDEADFIVCADGGALHLQKLGIKPDVLLGDFDSIEERYLEYYREQKVTILKYPTEKNMTDTELAVDTAIERGYKDIVIIGGTGTRLDHTLSNIFLLRQMLDRGVRGRIVNEYNEIFLIDDCTEVKAEEGYYLTLLPLTSKVEGITTKGLYYPLKGETIEMGSTRGVSNCFVSQEAQISITSGVLMVIKTRD
ncbi:MAG TPA: thiamine diphosphokinase [Clostridium sp.]|uniref:Thiamine diphosphokinase n=2 Tax=Acetivibrio mesophilus TaxID=2487273 RepID=A0A4Q0I705_9FIRM|nr:thiamine diphosphokinase [Acetivibrio mesophilus]HHV29057.1 thiamine diphosphokinase [Clostridium sp.]